MPKQNRPAMPLWLFTCTHPDRLIVSARVAAPTREGARDILEELLDTNIEAKPIVQPFGKADVSEPRVMRMVYQNGNVYEPVEVID